MCDVTVFGHALICANYLVVVTGTKVKSARTQTCSHAQKVVTSPKTQHPLYALTQENQYLFSPNKDVAAACGPLEGHLIPMAIPLGKSK